MASPLEEAIARGGYRPRNPTSVMDTYLPQLPAYAAEEEGLGGGVPTESVTGLGLSPLDLMGCGLPAKIALGAKAAGGALAAALGTTAIGSRASQGARLSPLAEALERQRGIFAGVNAKTANLESLAKAKEMQNAGIPDEIIHKETGKLKNFSRFPESLNDLRDKYIGMFSTDTTAHMGDVYQLKDGRYLATATPSSHLTKGGFYAVADDVNEAKNAVISSAQKSEHAKEIAATKKFNNSFAGKLQAATGENFNHFNSARSDSKYAIHDETGTKIRISDHELPGHYDSPDLDIPSWIDDKEKFNIIKNYIDAAKNNEYDRMSDISRNSEKLYKQ